MTSEVEQVFNDASLIAEMTVREQLSKAIADRNLYMAICCALLRRNSDKVEIMEEELIVDALVCISLNEDKDGFQIWIQDNEVTEEVKEDSEQMDTG